MVLNLSLEESSVAIDIQFDSDDDFGADFGEVIEVSASDIPVYNGEYSVKPLVTEQELATAGKMMRDDMKILSIPFFSVSNNAGGNTVYIGTEDEIIFS